MFKKVILTSLLICFAYPIFGQITSNKKANETLNWLIENPQIKSDSLFTEKSVEVLKWHAKNNSQVEMRPSGIGEFMDTSSTYKFFKEITMIYMLSEIDNQINKSIDENQSAFLSISNVIKFYENVITINGAYKNDILDRYSTFSEKELRKKMKKLIKR